MTRTPSKTNYKHADGYALKHVADRIYRSGGMFSSSKMKLLEGFFYANEEFPPMWCPPGFYDGFSIPAPVRFLSFGSLKGLMPVIQSTYVHDTACRKQFFTEEARVQLFEMAYDDAVYQFYDGEYPSRRRDRLVKGVMVGSKYLGSC